MNESIQLLNFFTDAAVEHHYKKVLVVSKNLLNKHESGALFAGTFSVVRDHNTGPFAGTPGSEDVLKSGSFALGSVSCATTS